MTLLYIGKGAFLRGVPRRDLSDAEAVKLGGVEFLVGTGLYAHETQQEDTREQQAPAAPIEKPKRKNKRAGSSESVKEG